MPTPPGASALAPQAHPPRDRASIIQAVGPSSPPAGDAAVFEQGGGVLGRGARIAPSARNRGDRGIEGYCRRSRASRPSAPAMSSVPSASSVAV